MYNSKIAFIVFILVAAVQLFVPVKMVLDRENILTAGKKYKFKTAPVDPSDPFRGKYITLDFAANTVKVDDKNAWENMETVFLQISNDAEGFAKIDTVTKQEPASGRDFIKAKINYVSYDSLLHIDYPFDKYYMEESKAPDAEKTYREYNRDTTHKTYALVSIKNGEAVLKDVMIDDISIKEIIKKQKQQ